MSFYIVAIATSVAGLLLGIGWLFAGKLVLQRWRIEPNDIGLLVGRRLGAVYLGTSLMLFLARSAPPSDVRSALSVGMFVSLALLAGLGLFEFKARRAGSGIFVSVAVEIILALGFAWVMLANLA
jgi:hypothetical protein